MTHLSRDAPVHVVGGAAGEPFVDLEPVDKDTELRQSHYCVELTAPWQLVGRDASHLTPLHLRRVRVDEVDRQQIQCLQFSCVIAVSVLSRDFNAVAL